jgi:hypothetical protein
MKFQASASFVVVFAAACSAGHGIGSGVRDNAGSGASGGSGPNIDVGVSGSAGMVNINVDGGTLVDTDGGAPDNPATCDQAANSHSYVGCEFWPTITANPVYVEFSPAVVVANGGTTDAMVTVDGPSAFHQQVTVAAGQLQTILLNWVPDLKGPEFSLTDTSGGRLAASSRVNGGAYHVTSSVPVTAWQFNPLHYEIPASQAPRVLSAGGAAECPTVAGDTECLSVTVDASLLLPTTAMTGNYRIFAYSSENEGNLWGAVPGGAAITATQDNTTVTVQLAKNCGVELYPTANLGTCIAAGTGVAEQNGGDIVTFMMNAGDVVQLVGAWSAAPQTNNADISGSVINASAPVQVVSFNAIAQLPDATVGNADHMEETVLPAEVLGNEYIVAPPTTPAGNAVGHVVRIYGNVDGTHLSYPDGMPPGAPTVINAGDMVQIPPIPKGTACNSAPGNCMVSQAFTVQGDQPFAVASFMVGGTLQVPGSAPTSSQGDPSMTMEVTPQQFRKQYTFLAPSDYEENFADVLVPQGAQVTLDGAPLTGTPEQIGMSIWSIVRAPLSGANGGVHSISTTDERGLGLQIEGFGRATSYYYPGGLNLKLISKPPVIPIVK